MPQRGISASEVVDAASTKPYGYATFRPGAGVGGHCIPIDPIYLIGGQNNADLQWKQSRQLTHLIVPWLLVLHNACCR
jgi:UDP-N-acetyl-D-glucosamine dehydrogenase